MSAPSGTGGVRVRAPDDNGARPGGSRRPRTDVATRIDRGDGCPRRPCTSARGAGPGGADEARIELPSVSYREGPEGVARFARAIEQIGYDHIDVLLGEHFSSVKGYDAYAKKIALAKSIGMDGTVSAFMEAAVWGTPDRILRKLEEHRGIVGRFELATSFRSGGTPGTLAESGSRLYAKEVLPVVRSW